MVEKRDRSCHIISQTSISASDVSRNSWYGFCWHSKDTVATGKFVGASRVRAHLLVEIT